MSEIKLIKDAESLSTSTDLNMYLENSMDAVRTNIGTKHIVKKQDDDEKLGLLNVRAFFFLILWYIFSAFTLFLNKYILTSLKGDPAVLGAMQMVMTTIFGFLQMYLPLGFYKPVVREGKPSNFWKNMILVGCMRFSTVVLGLIALKFVAVSFTETVKSSAPLFTCFISYALIGDLQNVYSKVLISGDKYRYTPAELQFYTSLSSIAVQIPACYFMIDMGSASKTFDITMISAYIINGICFHFQSISAYVLMSYISPVTHSVANTVKRAFLNLDISNIIW
ncbi:solute carrier family 35, member E2 [Mytilus galloprovincialis]|uniref:Solute carrier family 35, member E2 n=1 Tax=Mytilus galloprovincialis TaxID=29158 RepID=A0A8B6G813_MYTGA|nr:solute carrier family 35, member E2 [Mytilus galloprovincialis]